VDSYSYVGRHAELYDLFYQDKPYEREALVVQSCLHELGVPKGARLLDLACGTGRHSVVFERLGYDVTGVDSSADMLVRARATARQMGSKVEFYCQDIRALCLPGEPFAAATCLFDSIGYLRTNEGVREGLRAVHRHLDPDGLIVLEFWHAAAMLRAYEPVRVRRWTTPLGEVLRISQTELDPVRQLGTVVYSVYELFRDGTYSAFTETQTNRFFLVQEMSAFLERCGFMPVRWLSGFSTDAWITQDTWHVLAIARKVGNSLAGREEASDGE
jgi:SAM-dependent methyltransferase